MTAASFKISNPDSVGVNVFENRLFTKDVGLKGASFRNGLLCGVVDVTGGSLEETSLIVSISVTLEGVRVNRGVVEKVVLRVFLA